MCKEEKKNQMVIMDFSGAYQQETFYKEKDVTWVDCRNLSGTNCYCDEEAGAVLLEAIRKLPVQEIHFIDSGNYHYVSRIWLEKVKSPFRLLMFDNHTDMQPPAFGGLLSCGGWMDAALRELPLLKQVVLVGPDEEAFSQVDPELVKKVSFLSREKLREYSREKKRRFFQEIPVDLPIYISVDKDILCKKDASTTWSQGDLELVELLEYLEIVLERLKLQGQKPAGMDVCGECEPDQDGKNNDRANQRILELWQKGTEHEGNFI